MWIDEEGGDPNEPRKRTVVNIGRGDMRERFGRSKQDKLYVEELRRRKGFHGGVLLVLLIIVAIGIIIPFVIYYFGR